MTLPRIPYRLFVLLATACLSVSVHANDRDAYQRQLEDNRGRLQTLDKDLKSDQRKRVRVKDELTRHAREIQRLNSKINRLKRQINTKGQDLRGLEEKLVVQRRDTHAHKSRLASQLRSAYQMGRQTGVQLLLSQDNPSEFSRLSVYADYYTRAQQRDIHASMRSIQRLAETHLRVAKIRKSLRATQTKLSQSRHRRQSEHKTHARTLANLDSGIATKSRKVTDLKTHIGRLQALVEELEQKASRRNLAFNGQAGQLPWPVQGTLTASFGQSKSGGKLKWNGVYISAPQGQEIQAVADGEVVYADWLNGFGMLLIINHGNGFMSLYGGNRDLFTDIGDTIDKGQIVATVGDTFGHKNSGLYFEIRENAVPVDPGQWINPQMQFAKTGNLETR
ncbi:MAG TPA: hypothetical protein DD979_12895 [Gammaproteobacteria bacterium]|jgi:septal ring factor EnvC (AmiA/AmiB activator)|nr:hypothetical protein [Gammaproteobacteria bacterium]